MLAGSTIYLPEKVRSNFILDLIARERCTIFHSVPTMFLALIANKNFAAEKISSLRCSIISGAHTTAAQACDDSRENSSTKTVTCACVKIKSAAFDEKKLRDFDSVALKKALSFKVFSIPNS